MPQPVVIITDRALAEPPFLRRTADGWVGQRTYRVSTEDEVEAAARAPAYGSVWSSARPDLLLTALTTRYLAGKNNDAGEGGFTLVQCDYGGPSGSLSPPPTESLRYTELASGTENITVFFDPDPSITPPLNNGEGLPRLAGMVTAKVYSYWRTSVGYDWPRVIGLTRRKALNAGDLALPPIYGLGDGFRMSEGQVRYEGFSASVKNNLLEVVHDLTLAPDFETIWTREDEKGHALQSVVTELYGKESMDGLW